MAEEECKHGMIPAYCADCRGDKDADEEEQEYYEHWIKIGENSGRNNNSRGQSQ